MTGERVLISGATGLIGSALDRSLVTDGHTVIRLTRNPTDPRDRRWDPTAGELDPSVLDGIDAVIHLAGESIDPSKRSAQQRRAIMDSRVLSTRLLRTAIEARTDRPSVFVSASGIHFYGDRGDETLTESASSTTGFMPEVCSAWEREARTEAVRSVSVRTGVVLTAKGGALERMLLPAKLGLGGPIGGGRQWWSWITLDDIVGVYKHAALSSKADGPINGVSPNPVRQRAFAKTLGAVLRRPAFFPLPRPAVRVAFGELGAHLLLDSIRAVPQRLTDEGFSFEHPDLEGALRAVLA